jgi:hypothetical protein
MSFLLLVNYKKIFCIFCLIGTAFNFLAEDNHLLPEEKYIEEFVWYDMKDWVVLRIFVIGIYTSYLNSIPTLKQLCNKELCFAFHDTHLNIEDVQ